MINLGNVLIFGDSYSTFLGYIPEGYDYWYSEKIHPDNGVDNVDKTWWRKLMANVEGDLILNCSWSGTTICHTGWRGEDYSERSFVARLDKLIEEGFFEKNKIDTVLIYGGTNDSWIGVPMGEVMHGDVSRDDLFKFTPAVCRLLDRAREALPLGKIIYLANGFFRPEILDAIRHATKMTNSEMLVLQGIDLNDGHPTAKGMTEIAEAILEFIK
jgi:lysophospholipase L1-like esterase